MNGPRADGAARSTHTILAEPVGQTYDRLLRGGAASCGECWLVVRPGLALSANARRALKRLRPFLIAAEARGEWLGTRLVGHTPLSTRPCAPRPRRAAGARRGVPRGLGPAPAAMKQGGKPASAPADATLGAASSAPNLRRLAPAEPTGRQREAHLSEGRADRRPRRAGVPAGGSPDVAPMAIGGAHDPEGGPQAARAGAHGEDRRVLYGGARPAPSPPRGPDGDRLAAALHITNGDSTVVGLQAAGPAWRVLSWRDALHEGPVPDVPEAALRRRRAAVLGDADPAGQAALLRSLEARDATLERGREGAYVLWFEADLYDQLQLVQVLARLGGLGVPPARITLVCIGEHLGFAHFGGLGELTPAQLHGLPATAATALSPAALAFAGAAWAAFRAPHPAGLGAIAATPSPELRFVAEAFDRLSREYPSTRDGLSLTERRLLAAPDAGGSAAGAVFRRVWAREARPYLGDSFCWRILARLVRARTPLLAADPADAPIAAATRLRRTAAGERVLRGEADHVALSGLDRWIGGVHLAGPTARWRWDEGTESLV